MISVLYPGETRLRVRLAAPYVVTTLDDHATASSTASEHVSGGEVKGDKVRNEGRQVRADRLRRLGMQ